jgi:hypothetical protein
MATHPGPAAAVGAIPQLAFAVQGAEPVRHAATPTLALALRIDSVGGAVRAILLDVQVQLAARRRRYDGAEEERLVDLFGAPGDWSRNLRTLLWARTTVQVAAFSGSTLVEVPVACTYDLEVAAARYLDALRDGEVPLELLFSGSLFYAGDGGALQTVRLSWEHEAEYRLPVRVWRETLDRYFPGSAWIRMGRERHERLAGYRARHALGSWDDVVDALLEGRE